jgi:hypothetical protein
MSIKKFEQFINESVEVNKEKLCNNETINNAYSKLVELSRQSFERNIEKLTLQLKLIDRAIEMIKGRYGDHIISEPKIYIKEIETGSNGSYYKSEGMYTIDLEFNTDIQCSEHDDYQDDIDNLEREINKVFNDEYNNEYIGIYEEPLYVRESYFHEYGKKDNEPMEIIIRIDGIFTTGLISLCRFNNSSYNLEKLLK